MAYKKDPLIQEKVQKIRGLQPQIFAAEFERLSHSLHSLRQAKAVETETSAAEMSWKLMMASATDSQLSAVIEADDELLESGLEDESMCQELRGLCLYRNEYCQELGLEPAGPGEPLDMQYDEMLERIKIRRVELNEIKQNVARREMGGNIIKQ